jgi:hypothetical protein
MKILLSKMNGVKRSGGEAAGYAGRHAGLALQRVDAVCDPDLQPELPLLCRTCHGQLV